MSVTQNGNHMTIQEGKNRVDVYLDLENNNMITIVGGDGKILYNGDSKIVAQQVITNAVPKVNFVSKKTDVHAIIGKLLANRKTTMPAQRPHRSYDPRPKPQNYGKTTDPLGYESDT